MVQRICIANKLVRHILVRIIYVCKSSERYKSYYRALGLDSTATSKEIKSAYYKLSLKFHPDKNNGSKESVVKFREITEAYEILGNSEKKRKYDYEYHSQPNYNLKYNNTEKFYRSVKHQRPYTGKTKDFDYDEHFKKHYQDFERHKEAEFKYYTRRRETDFQRRYQNYEGYYRNRNYYRKDEEFSKSFSQRIITKQHSYYMISAIWTVIFLIGFFQLYADPENHKS